MKGKMKENNENKDKNIDPKLARGREKTSFENIPIHTVISLAEVMTTGLRKYGLMTWRREMDFPAYRDAAMRHLTAYFNGEMNDAESKKPHLIHAMACCMILADMEKIKRESKENEEKNK